MSSVLRIVILAVISVALLFVGLAGGLIFDSDVRGGFDVVPEAPQPMGPRIIRVSVPIEVPIRVPAPYAIADEALGAYRVNGYVVFSGPMRFSTHRSIMACFPVDG